MFIVFLKFSVNKSEAPNYMQAHNEWIQENLQSEIFLLAGTLEPKQGGCIVADAASKSVIEKIISTDPFVVNNVVTAEILEVTPATVDKRLSFLMQ